MPYYEYKGKIDRVLCPVIDDSRCHRILPNQIINGTDNEYINKYIAIYFKIDKSNIIFRNKLRYMFCTTYNGYPNDIPINNHNLYDTGGNNNGLHYGSAGMDINPLPEPFPIDEQGNAYLEIRPDNRDFLPSVKLCLLYGINSDYYLRIFVPSMHSNLSNPIQFLKPDTYVEVVFRSTTNPISDNTAALITFANEF